MTRWHHAPEVLEAARLWKERCLLDDGSIFGTGRLWTSDNIAYLDRYFGKNPDAGEGDFFGKLETQLAPTPAPAKQLAAEMLWLMFIFVAARHMGGPAKRRAITRVWEWSGEPLPDNQAALGAVLDRGVGGTGTAYNTLRWRELAFLIAAMGQWKRLTRDEQRARASDPWEFAAWIDSLEESKGRQLREILLYLLFPETFERIATGRDKRRIVDQFRKEFGEEKKRGDYSSRLDVDREVLRVRERLATDLNGQDLDFYSQALTPRWRDAATPEPGPQPTNIDAQALDHWYEQTFHNSQVWTIGAGEGGRLWPEFQRDGIVALGFDMLGDLAELESRTDMHRAIAADRPDGPRPVNDSLAAWQFAHEMKIGDVVIAKRGLSELLGYGIVQSDYEFDDSRTEYQHIRRVKWERLGSWNLPAEQQAGVKALTNVSDLRVWLRCAWDLMTDQPAIDKSDATPATAPDVPYTDADATAGLFISRKKFKEILDAIGRKKCVILEGPPGVGKTFMARRLAYALMAYKDSRRVEMIQFHQSYAYEDFVQGWRPCKDGGFRLQDGVFHRFCQRARRDLQRPYVFVIDEINRGNLSKIFGELMMLIEADKRGAEHAVQLTYSQGDDERFSVPENVYIIGLMNTADRSLALVDYALRRRFSFVRLRPEFGSEQFVPYLVAAGVSEELANHIVKRLEALNHQIREDKASLGTGFEIGHSFFVPPEGAARLDQDWFAGVVRSEIQPLLVEYWFDQPERVEAEVARLLP